MVLLFIRKTTGTTLAIDIEVQATVLALKETLHAIDGSVPARQTLIFAGRVLKDDATLLSYNITKECSIQLFTSAVQRLKDGEEIKNGENIGPAPVELTPESSQTEGKKLSQRVTNPTSAVVSSSNRSHQQEGGVCDVLRHGDIVVIRLLEARNLERADFWPVLSGSSDPYVIFALGNNSAKSKIIRRNLNPVWNETFGFRINEEDERAILRVLVFDFDNFTPDDFIGSVEINLSGLQRGKMIDRWVDLQNVKTGQIHLQFHRSILTSPSLNAIVTSLMELERSWTPEDLSRHGIKLEHLTGELAWFTENTTNPAIEHLAESIRMGNIDWKASSLARIETILTSQGLCTTPGLPTPYVWFSGIASDCPPTDLIQEIRKHAAVKHITFASNGSAFVGFRSISDSLLCFLHMQHKQYHNGILELGFGRYIPRNDPFLTSCIRAGFLYLFHRTMTNWIYGWMFLVNGSIHFFSDLQHDAPTFSIDLGQIYICSHGPNSIELHDKSKDESVFIRSESNSQIIDWKLVFKKIQRLSSPGNARSELDFAIEGSMKSVSCRCNECSKDYPLNEVYFHGSNENNSNSYVCIYCLRQIILKKVESGEVTSLSSEFTVQDIRDLLYASEFESYLDSSLRELLDADDNFVKCPKCSVAVEFVRDGVQDMPDFSRLIGVDGKPISIHTQSHYLNNRLRCRNSHCTIDFCRSCRETPYHAGFECEEFKDFKSAEHCRFCDCALLVGKTLATDPPSKALERCCNQPDCLRKRDQACLDFLPCGHYCGGVRGEQNHPHCLLDDLKPEHVTQDHSDFCNICFTESLGASPVIELDCGHFFHFECVKKRLTERWSTPQITFGFCKCPLCKINIHHELLIPCLSPIWELHRDIESKAYNRLIYEGLLKNEELQENGMYYRNAMGYAIQYFAYYMCFKCKVPYFGGQPRCNDGLDHFDPSELVCGPCSGIGVSECASHGKDFIQFKCRFCCNLSTWYCWGTTHFCDDCHRRQEAHDYMSTKSPEELVQCEGPAKCPLGIEHPPNGEEFSLGCSLCRGGATQQGSH